MVAEADFASDESRGLGGPSGLKRQELVEPGVPRIGGGGVVVLEPELVKRGRSE